MVDKEDKDNFDSNEELPEGRTDVNLGASKKVKTEDISPFPESDDDLADDVPAVSIDKKKNTAMFIGGALIVVFIL